ncbi:hypothetical protein AAC387_Pa04g1548 [Persea americana]
MRPHGLTKGESTDGWTTSPNGTRSFNICMAEVNEDRGLEDSLGRYELEEPLRNHLQRQEDQIENLMDMLVKLKEKLESSTENKNLEKELAGSDEGIAKEVVPKPKTGPSHSRPSDGYARGSQNQEG